MEEEQDINGLIFRIRMPSLFAIVRTAFPVNLLRLFLPPCYVYTIYGSSSNELDDTQCSCAAHH